MGRPLKQTVEFFPHMAGASNGKTLYVIESHFGNDGYAFWFKVLELLAQSQSHSFCYQKPSDWQFLLAKTHVESDRATKILQTLAELEAIDPDLHRHSIIWSQNFVDNLEPLYARRKGALPQKPLPPTTPLIVDNSRVEESRDNSPDMHLLHTETKILSTETGVNVTETPKRSKKELPKTVYGQFKNVLLTDEEYQKLLMQFGDAETSQKIERLSEGIASKGYKYKSHYATILNWARRDGQEGKDVRVGINRGNSKTDGAKDRTAELEAGWK